MSKRLTGLNPLAYIGVEPVQPVNTFMRNFAPGPTDSRNVNIGDFWVDTATQTLWVLVSLAGGNAVWISLFGGSADSFVTDSGTAVPAGGVLNVNGDGLNILTSGSGNTIVIRENPDPTFGNVTITGTLDLTALTQGVLVSNNSGVISEVTTTNHSLLVGNSSGTISSLGVATNGQIPIGSTGADPVLSTITAGTGISVTNGAGSITIAATGAVAESFATDSGTAVPAAGVLTIHGGTGVTTSGAGSTVTITATGGTGTVTSITAGTGITLTPSPITTTGSVALTVPVVVANGGTGDTSFTAYSVITGGTTSTGALQNVSGVGTAGQVLTSNGAAALPTWQGASGGGLTLIQTQTASGVVALNFTTGITGTYRNYLILVDNINDPTASSSKLYVQLSTNGGSSYITSGYQSSTGADIGLVVLNGLGSTGYGFGSSDLMNLTSGVGFIASQGSQVTFVASSSIAANSIAGAYNTAATTANALRVVIDGTATWSGNVSLYGYSM